MRIRKKPFFSTFLLLGFMMSVSSCSSETLKRASYDTLQNVEEMRCNKEMSEDCPDRVSYDEYQDKLKENENQE